MDSVLNLMFASGEDELHVLHHLAYLMMFVALCTFVTLLFENVPYGRYTSCKYGFPVDVRVAWFLQELPAILVPLNLLVWTSASKMEHKPNQLLIGMYLCHYIQRLVMFTDGCSVYSVKLTRL